MAVTVAGKNYTQISTCDTTDAGGTWAGVDTPDTTNYKEGGASLCGTLKASGDNDATFAPTAAIDMTGTKHLRLWYLNTSGGLINTYANGGIQLGISDGSNTGYWKLAGRDTYAGGWLNLVIDVSKDVDLGTKPTAMSAITSIIARHNQTAAGKNVDNVWVDNLCLCDGLVAYGDDEGGYFDFENIFAADDATTGGWGIIRKISGQYFLTGSLEIGDGAGTAGCKFQAKSQVAVFEDRKVNTALYAITVVDNGTGVTEFILGDKAGTAGIEGCTIRVALTAQTPKYKIDGGTDTDVDNFKLYGSTFLDASTLKFPDDAVNVEILNCNFESCDEIMATTAIIKNCNLVSANDEAFVLPTGNTHKLEYCNFINNPYAWRCPSAGTFTCSGCKFINNTKDIHYTAPASSGTLTINKSNEADPSTYEILNPAGNTVNIVSTVSLALTGIPDGTEATVARATTARTVLYHVESTSGGTVQYDYGTTEIGYVVDVLFMHTSYDPHIGDIVDYTLGSGNATIPITLVNDPTYSNP